MRRSKKLCYSLWVGGSLPFYNFKYNVNTEFSQLELAERIILNGTDNLFSSLTKCRDQRVLLGQKFS